MLFLPISLIWCNDLSCNNCRLCFYATFRVCYWIAGWNERIAGWDEQIADANVQIAVASEQIAGSDEWME